MKLFQQYPEVQKYTEPAEFVKDYDIKESDFILASKSIYDKYFKEMNKAEKDCEFVGCTHIKEKECGIRKALEQGEISNSRYQNYIKIYEDLKDKEEHKW